MVPKRTSGQSVDSRWMRRPIVCLALLFLCLALGGLGCRACGGQPPEKPTQLDLPRGKPGHFSIAIADFEDDQRKAKKQILVASINTWRKSPKFLSVVKRARSPGIDLFDYPVHVPMPKDLDVGRRDSNGHAAARSLLIENGLDLIVWGRVTELDRGILASYIYITALKTDGGGELYPLGENGLRVEPEFEQKLLNLVELVIASRLEEAEKPRGRDVSDILLDAAERADDFVNWEKFDQFPDREWRAGVRRIVADVHRSCGEQAEGAEKKKHFDRAIELLERACEDVPKDDYPVAWANVSISLSTVHALRARHEKNIEELHDAATTLKEPVRVLRSRVPPSPDWVWANIKLGMLHSELAQLKAQLPVPDLATRDGIDDLFNSAIGEIGESIEALEKNTKPGGRPLGWLEAKEALGLALHHLGKNTNDVVKAKKAFKASKNVFDVILKDYSLMKRQDWKWADLQQHKASAGLELVLRSNSSRDLVLKFGCEAIVNGLEAYGVYKSLGQEKPKRDLVQKIYFSLEDKHDKVKPKSCKNNISDELWNVYAADAEERK